MTDVKLFLALMLTLVFAQGAKSATITVLNGNETGPGSLREAIETAVSGDLIVFDPSVTSIILSTGQFVIDKSITIRGTNVEITGTVLGCTFKITENADVTLDGLTFKNLTAELIGIPELDGGAVLNSGNLTVKYCLFEKVTAGPGSESTRGGAIANFGALEVINSEFIDNISSSGGAIYSNGNMIVSNSIFERNNAASISVTIAGAILIEGEGENTIISSDFIGNCSKEGIAGAICSLSDFRTNLKDCLFKENFALGGSAGTVGAVCGKVNAENCLFFRNFSATASFSNGGAFDGSDSDFTNCTFFENRVTAFSAQGGALRGSDVRLFNCTIINNEANGEVDLNGEITAGGIQSIGLGVEVNNTIIAGNKFNEIPSDIAGTVGSSNGHNIISNTDNGAITGNTEGNITPDENPLVEDPFNIVEPTLGRNGGRTQTLALLTNSPAVDAGTASTSLTDQRDLIRDGIPDIGAFEFGADPDRCLQTERPNIQTELCPCGGKATLTALGNFTDYRWSTGETTQSIEVGNSGTFSVVTRDGNGCPNLSEVTVDFKDETDPDCQVVIEDLELVSVCSDNPDQFLRWQINNPNPFPVRVSWYLVRTFQFGVIMAPPGESFFLTSRRRGRKKAKIVWRNEMNDIKAASAESTFEACPGANARIADTGRIEEKNSIQQDNIMAYPNPVRNTLTVELAPDTRQNGEIVVYDIRGLEIYRQALDKEDLSNKRYIDTSYWTKGIYVVQMEMEGEQSKTLRIIKE